MKQSILYPQAVVGEQSGICPDQIDTVKMISDAQNMKAGAMVIFVGTVRTASNGKNATGLFYEAYTEMAELLLKEILADSICMHKLINASCQHRIGLLSLGEIAVVVITSAEHRKEAYDANQYIIARVKFELPIWKNEFYTDGTKEWRPNSN